MTIELRVGVFMDKYLKLKTGAGTENQVRGLLQHLDPSRVEAHMVTLRGEPAGRIDPEFPCTSESLGIGKVLSLGGLKGLRRIVALLKQRRFDVVMTYFPDASFLLPLACRLAGGVPCVINRRDMGFWYTPREVARFRTTNRLARAYLANAEAIRQRVIEVDRFPADRIHVIPNGLFRDDSLVASPRTRADMGLPESSPLVGIVANMRPVKRIDWFLDVAQNLIERGSPADFVIVGRGPLEDEARAEARSRGLGDRVHFLGGQEEVRDLIAMLRVGVLTSESEGLSNTLIECASQGVPAVAFDVGGNREVIQDAATGFVVPLGDTERFADRVNELVADDELHRDFGARAARRAAERFSPEAIVEQYMELWRSLKADGVDV